jgi:septum site-determining protein MinC
MMPAAAERAADDALELKGTVSSLTVVRLRTVDLARVEADLAERVARHPQIFQNAPAVVDAALLDGAALDWEKLVAALRAVKLVPVAAANARGPEAERALAAGLASIQLGPRLRTVEPEAPASASSPPVPTPAAAREVMTLTTPVRGGQVVYAKGTDLVVCASVNPGAQVIADGSVHVWGPLRGRALAGAQGKAEARIFCLSLEAELVSVNGEYMMAEEIPDGLRGKPAQIFLDCGRVKIAAL